MSISRPFKRRLVLVVKWLTPFVLWLVLCRGFFSARNLMIHDTFEVYANLKYFFDSLSAGTYPFWDPFVLWGAPIEMSLHVFGQFNPFLYLILLFNHCGLSFFHAFSLYLIVTHGLGLAGFALLARRLLRDDGAAYLAYVAFLFSSWGMLIFVQILMLLIYVPAVWFFYFLVRFLQDHDRGAFCGMVFALMVIVTTYLPFYTFTVFLFAAVTGAGLFFRDLRAQPSAVRAFARRNKGLVVTALLAFGTSCVLPILVFRSSGSEDIVVPTRHHEEAGTMGRGILMNYEEAGQGGLAANMAWEDLFSGLDHIDYQNDGFVYLPFFVVLVFGIAVRTRITRTGLALFLTALLIFLTALAGAAPFHRWCFTFLPYFRMMRNIYFFIPFLLSAVCLLFGEQLKGLFRREPGNFGNKTARLIPVILVHGGALMLLVRLEQVPVSTYVTLAASLLFFTADTLLPGMVRRPAVQTACCAALLLIQPVEVFDHYGRDSGDFESSVVRSALEAGTAQPVFSYERPTGSRAQYENHNPEKDPIYHLNRHRLTMTDSPGFITNTHGYPARCSYLLNKKADEDAVRKLTRYKFLLYDEPPPADILQPPAGNGIIRGPSEKFRVTGFQANGLTLETDDPQKKFLVYNDSFHSGWKAFVNDRPAGITRANTAFKGLWLPAGRNEVRFVYEPAGGYGLYIFTLAVFFAFFGLTVVLLMRPRNE